MINFRSDGDGACVQKIQKLLKQIMIKNGQTVKSPIIASFPLRIKCFQSMISCYIIVWFLAGFKNQCFVKSVCNKWMTKDRKRITLNYFWKIWFGFSIFSWQCLTFFNRTKSICCVWWHPSWWMNLKWMTRIVKLENKNCRRRSCSITIKSIWRVFNFIFVWQNQSEWMITIDIVLKSLRIVKLENTNCRRRSCSITINSIWRVFNFIFVWQNQSEWMITIDIVLKSLTY